MPGADPDSFPTPASTDTLHAAHLHIRYARHYLRLGWSQAVENELHAAEHLLMSADHETLIEPVPPNEATDLPEQVYALSPQERKRAFEIDVQDDEPSVPEHLARE